MQKKQDENAVLRKGTTWLNIGVRKAPKKIPIGSVLDTKETDSSSLKSESLSKQQ
ncbi:hypothetical protein STEG23_012878, partial [Scotinomys teguina]